MLPARHRLRGKRVLERVQRSRLVARSPLFTVRTVIRDDQGPVRVAIAVGRHVSPRAVERNRVTRWLREVVRAELPGLRAGVDLRLSAGAPVGAYSLVVCRREVHALFRRAGVVQTQ